MSLIKFMLGGLVLTALLAGVSFVLWGNDVALAVAIVSGGITQHGTLAAAALGFPHYGFWE